MGTLLATSAAVNQITIDELVSLISERPGAMPISFVARTKVGGSRGLNKKHRDTKQPNSFGDVWKTAYVSGMVNCSYKNAWEKETGEAYVPGESWHDAALDVDERLTPFAEHKDGSGKLYLRVMKPKTLESSMVSDKAGVVTYADLAPYMAPPRDEPVVPFLTYGLEGLREVTFGGATYQIVTTQTVLEREEKALAELMV